MKPQKKRIRMFAGPNGSGKSTMKQEIPQDLIGIYINPDDIERGIRETGYLNLKDFEIEGSENEVLSYFYNSDFLKSAGFLSAASGLRYSADKLLFSKDAINAYFASVASDFIRRKLLLAGKSFSFETVMSSADKVQFLKTAQSHGYRTYLYYVATEDPKINIDRVRQRIEKGGHPVPEDKIVSRYHRSLELLADAIRNTNRTYLWDNTSQLRFLLEVIEGKELIVQTEDIPGWCQRALHETFATVGGA